jgi:hypothetical protein
LAPLLESPKGVENRQAGQKADAEPQNSASKWSRNNLLLPKSLQFDCQSTVFINLIQDQALLICLSANVNIECKTTINPTGGSKWS